MWRRFWRCRKELTQDGLKPGLFLGEQIDRTLADGALDAGIGNIA
jgi:hypothetical protein